jgi:hypothetical protein
MGTVRVRAVCMIRTVACSLSRSYMASVRSECTVRAFTAATRTTRPRAATRNQHCENQIWTHAWTHTDSNLGPIS